MKTLKNMIAMLLALAAICSMTACGKPEAQKQDATTQPSITQTENATQNVTEDATEPVKNAKYESDVLIPYAQTAAAKDIFAGYADDAQKMFYTTDGRLLEADTLENSFWFGSAEPQEVFAANNQAVYKDAKGYLYINSDNRIYPCQNIQGKIFWFFTDMLSGNLTICSRDEDGNMYINVVDSTGTKERDNEKLYLYEYDTKTYIENADFVRMVQDDRIQKNIYAEVNGKAYYENVTGISFFDNKPQIWVSSKNCWGAQNVMDYGYGGANSPLYEKEGDNSALYYQYGWSGTELPVFMPQGKTVDLLERVVFGETTYLFFNDGSVYSGVLVDTIVGPELALDETLTNLNKDSAILDVFQSTFIKEFDCTLRLLLDDNVTYDYMK